MYVVRFFITRRICDRHLWCVCVFIQASSGVLRLAPRAWQHAAASAHGQPNPAPAAQGGAFSVSKSQVSGLKLIEKGGRGFGLWTWMF
jgi:hypothetical protein